MEHLAWPAAVALLGVVFIFKFQKQIAGFIDRLRKLGKWAEATAAELPQRPPDEEGQLPGTGQGQLQLPGPTTAGGPVAQTPAVMIEKAIQDWATPMILERERAITEGYAVFANPADRERVLTRHLAAMYVIQWFERIHNTIFGSQIFALARLNSATDEGAEEGELRAFYDDALKTYPAMAATVSFEQWIGYLVDSQLVVRLESGRYALTADGHEFMVHLAKSRKEVFKIF